MLYKCKNCGGELHFDPNIGKLKCDFCDAVYDISEYENQVPSHSHDGEPVHPQVIPEAEEPQAGRSAIEAGFDKATDDSTEVKSDLRLYQCPHCGAEVVTDKTTTATNCVFCNTPLVLQENMTGEFAPDAVIPFEVDRKQIERIYEDYIRTKPFYPNEYSKANVIEKIKAVYLPFWLYSTKTKGALQATGERTSTFTTRDWIVTNHDVFDLERAGSMNFSRIPAIASSKTPTEAMDSIEPFNYEKLVDFNTGYLPGFMAERYDIRSKEMAQSAHERAAQTFQNQMNNTMSGYSSVHVLNGTMDHEDLEPVYAMMPAYILFMDYDNDEDKLIAINGQTGKIAGNIPVDKKKRNLFFLKWMAILWIVLFVLGELFFVG